MNQDGASKKAVIIGAGLGGLSAAMSLAGAGMKVVICEKNPQAGGKLNLLKKDGFSFDMGPSILTLPKIFEQVFAAGRKNLKDYLSFIPVHPHWRNFFEDGKFFDLVPDTKEMEKQLEHLGIGLEKSFREFLGYSKRQYDAVQDAYFSSNADNLGQMIRACPLRRIAALDLFHRMDKGVKKRLAEPHLQDVMDFFIKYVGSSALNSPGFMNMLPNVQFEFGLWYVKGGLYSLARAFTQTLEELGATLRFNSEVVKITTEKNQATGVVLKDGTVINSDYVVSNMEIIPAHQKLLPYDPAIINHLEKKFPPACSGLIIHLGTKRRYEQLAHHNFFFSGNQAQHFRSVFDKGELPQDPTLYVVAPSRTDPGVCPEGMDNIKVLPHIPPLSDKRVYTEDDYERLKQRVIKKLERMGLDDLRKNTVVEHVWTPKDIQKNYYSNAGSIYGVLTDIKKNFGFKAPRKSSRYQNLFFVGGSVNPGGGMPMVLMSGLRVGSDIIKTLEIP